MTQATSPSDGSDSLNRRNLLRLRAASIGASLIACVPASPAQGEQSAQVNSNADRISDAPPLPREDHSEARARTIDNLKRIGLAMGGYAAANHGRFPAAAIRKDGKPLLSWRVALLPFLDVYRGARLYHKFRLDEPWNSPHNGGIRGSYRQGPGILFHVLSRIHRSGGTL